MRKALITLLLSPLTASCIAYASCADTYVTPFGAELYSPESESTIESRAFEKHLIPSATAEALKPEKHPANQESEYDSENVRALILAPGTEIYVDRFGWIRQGKIYGKADPQEIEKLLSTPCTNK